MNHQKTRVMKALPLLHKKQTFNLSQYGVQTIQNYVRDGCHAVLDGGGQLCQRKSHIMT